MLYVCEEKKRRRLSWKYSPLLTRIALPQDKPLNSVVNLCLSAVTTRGATAVRKSSPLLTGNSAGEAEHRLSPPLKRALLAWLAILGSSVEARSILDTLDQKPADSVMFTAGPTPLRHGAGTLLKTYRGLDGRCFGEALWSRKTKYTTAAWWWMKLSHASGSRDKLKLPWSRSWEL